MNDLITIIVAGVETLFLGAETLLTWLNATYLFGATLYAWFLGLIVLDTIIGLFFPSDNDESTTIADMLGDSETPQEIEMDQLDFYELD